MLLRPMHTFIRTRTKILVQFHIVFSKFELISREFQIVFLQGTVSNYLAAFILEASNERIFCQLNIDIIGEAFTTYRVSASKLDIIGRCATNRTDIYFCCGFGLIEGKSYFPS
jgi:hypothetical protein